MVLPPGSAFKEVDMLLHLPIAILTTLSPTPVSDTVPKFDIVKECRFEGGSSVVFDRCSHDEAEALADLKTEWSQFSGADRNACFSEATVAGFTSYVDLLICLEMARDVNIQEKTASDGPDQSRSAPPADPEVNVVDKRQ
jgi:hypothetical protein